MVLMGFLRFLQKCVDEFARGCYIIWLFTQNSLKYQKTFVAA